MNKSIFKTALLLALALTLAFSTTALAEKSANKNIPLDNDRAEVGTDCPATGGPYWHFVINPNNNQSEFITFYLNLGDAAPYTTTAFVPNGSQQDNVFVAVPAGKTLTDLDKTGSRADIYWSGIGVEPDKFVLSHVCPGAGYEALTVTKTANTSFTREHFWDIDKKVETEFGYFHNDLPKIWLFIDGSGDEIATWTVDVTYQGYEDSDFNVSGVITIENTGTLDAVINSVDDFMAGTPISVDCGVTFPYTLPKGETLTCTYSEDVESKINGSNVVTVTTERDEYGDTASLTWGAPTSEINKTVTVQDISDLFGQVELGTVTAPNGATFTYTKDFAWADYGADGCGDYVYDNTATIVETGQSASARLKVNVQCYVYETAFAKADDGSRCFLQDGFSRWGWTNAIAVPGTYTMPLWAGAGQCDTSKGTLVGSVTVTYTGSAISYSYNVAAPYMLADTHFYAGNSMYPMVKSGKKWVATVAPGQYYITNPLFGPIWVIAHAVVGLPDPNFGP